MAEEVATLLRSGEVNEIRTLHRESGRRMPDVEAAPGRSDRDPLASPLPACEVLY